MKRIFVIIILIILIIAVGAVGYFLSFYNTINMSITSKGLVACTKEAKICPDGSAVGRAGPKCDFAPCPDFTKGWKTYDSSQYGFEMKYPEDFFDANQQPKLLAGECNYNVFPNQCPNINNIVADGLSIRGGDANAIRDNLSNPGYWDISGQKQTINNTEYCLYATGDAATGHAFNYYYYATVKNNKCLVVHLAASTENCDVYLPLESGNTEQANNYNNCVKTNSVQPTVLNEVVSTFKFSK